MLTKVLFLPYDNAIFKTIKTQLFDPSRHSITILLIFFKISLNREEIIVFRIWNVEEFCRILDLDFVLFGP